MDFHEYQEKSRETAIYARIGDVGFVYPVLGLAGEAGEVAERVKKIMREPETSGAVTGEDRADMQKELGDVLWYIAQLATEFDLSLEEIATANIEKLQARKKEGSLHTKRR